MIKDAFKEWKAIRAKVNNLFCFVKDNDENIILWFVKDIGNLYKLETQKSNIKLMLKMSLIRTLQLKVVSYHSFDYKEKLFFKKLRLSLFFFLKRHIEFDVVILNTLKHNECRTIEKMSLLDALFVIEYGYSISELENI